MDWTKGPIQVTLAMLVVCAFMGACSARGAGKGSGVRKAAESEFLAQTAGRVDELRWSVRGTSLTGTLQSFRVDPSAPTFLKTASAEFRGSVARSRVELWPVTGSGPWRGQLVRDTLTLTWTSDGSAVTTVFFHADSQALDGAQQALDQQLAVDRGLAQHEAAKAPGTGPKGPSTPTPAALAQRAAAQARAAAGRASAARAAQHHHP